MGGDGGVGGVGGDGGDGYFGNGGRLRIGYLRAFGAGRGYLATGVGGAIGGSYTEGEDGAGDSYVGGG